MNAVVVAVVRVKEAADVVADIGFVEADCDFVVAVDAVEPMAVNAAAAVGAARAAEGAMKTVVLIDVAVADKDLVVVLMKKEEEEEEEVERKSQVEVGAAVAAVVAADSRVPVFASEVAGIDIETEHNSCTPCCNK